MNTVPTNDEQLRAEVRARYAKTALQVLGTEQFTAQSCCGPSCCTPAVTTEQKSEAEPSACCGSSCCSTEASGRLIISDLYTQAELGTIPLAAALPHAVVAIQRLWPNSNLAKRCWTWVAVAALTFCSPRNEWDRQVLPTVWI